MTPRKGETPEEFRARQRARYAAADPEYREQRLARQRERRRQRYATDPVYGNSSWKASASGTLLIPSTGKRSWNRSGNVTPVSGKASGKSESA